MKNIRLISFISGTSLLPVILLMLLSGFVDLEYQYNSSIFFNSAFFTSLISLVFIKAGKLEEFSHDETWRNINLSLVTSVTWIIIPLFCSVPIFCETNLSIIEAIFEAVSGITTTGATIIKSVEMQTKGILFWRAALHFLGGIGIILSSAVLFPIFQKCKLTKLLHFELHDTNVSSKKNILYSPFKTCILTFVIYTIMNILCFLSYITANMSIFDAFCHAMSTVSTGGFSNYDNSIGHYRSIAINTISIIFMTLNSLPFSSYIRLPHKLIFDDQSKFYIKLMALISILSIITIYANKPTGTIHFYEIIIDGIFTSVSLMSSTGFSNSNYDITNYMSIIGVFVMLIGGCSQSTAGGLKIFRFAVILRNIKNTKLNLNKMHVIKINDHALEQNEILNIYNYAFLYLFTASLSSIMISLTGENFGTSISSAFAALSNSGFGFDKISSNYSELSGIAKFILICTMLAGRLENLIISVIFISLFDYKILKRSSQNLQ